jgi:hypothetical protein
MDDTVKTMATTLAQGFVKKVLISGGALLAGHGIATGFTATEYTAASVAIVAAAWSFWQDYGKAIITSQVKVLKARSLASAAKIQNAGLKSVTISEIAAQSPTLTETEVIKVAATLPPEVAASVVPVAKS